MNSQIRKLYLVVFLMVLSLTMAATYIQFVAAPELNADARNSRTILHAAERDRGPIIVDGVAIAESVKIEGSRRFERSYPGGDLYAHTTGWFSSTLGSSTGLESAADAILEGDAPSLFTQRVQNLLTGQERRGGGIDLTIDAPMQEAAASALGGRKGAVVALEAKTGAIKALYSSPSFSPDKLATTDSGAALEYYKTLEDDPAKPLYNRAIGGDRYPPGSAFKIVTAAAMLESGEYTPDTNIDGPATYTLPGTATELPNITGLPCGDGNPTLSEAFARSCNTSFAIGGVEVGADALQEKASAFGFGEKLNIPMYVTPSQFPESINEAQTGLVSIGQSDLQVTPMQMAMIGAAVANDGTIMKPYIIDSVLNSDLEVQDTTEPEVFSEALTPQVASQLRSMMVSVVETRYGTGGSMFIDGQTVAAKTGTAEAGDHNIAWSIAFIANDNPIVVAVAVEGDELTPSPGGGSDAGPVVRAVLQASGGAK
ncbi:MAG: penicillin-binding transpeptidase domain-containing protein [Actinomycetaceae bacterium]|nr:penicillin-binding transpeptidase domain-containing protein [Actinomycetaceae bacterium]